MLIITTFFLVPSIAVCIIAPCTAAVPTQLATHLLQHVGKAQWQNVALLLVLFKIALGESEVLKGRGLSAVMSTLACLAATQHSLISFPFVRIDP